MRCRHHVSSLGPVPKTELYVMQDPTKYLDTQSARLTLTTARVAAPGPIGKSIGTCSFKFEHASCGQKALRTEDTFVDTSRSRQVVQTHTLRGSSCLISQHE